MAKIKRWTAEEVEYLKNMCGKIPMPEIAEKLGRSESATRTKATSLGFTTRNIWTDEDVKFLQENYLTLGAEEVARRLGRTTSAVHTRIRIVGGGRKSIGPRVEWSQDDLDFLKENYQEMPIEEIAEYLDRTESAICRRAQMIGIKRYIDPFPFFQEWSEESAYFVGFFAADGWVTKRGPNSIRLGVSQKEREIIDKISEVIGAGRITEKANGMTEFYFHSVKVYEWLCQIFGFDVYHKTHDLAWPAIPDEFTRHFLRGAFDGDGSIMWHGGFGRIAYATSSARFAYALYGEILHRFGIEMSVGLNKMNVWHARSSGIKAACICDWLYRDSSIAISRKKEAALGMASMHADCQKSSLTPKMREMFPHIIENYRIV